MKVSHIPPSPAFGRALHASFEFDMAGCVYFVVYLYANSSMKLKIKTITDLCIRSSKLLGTQKMMIDMQILVLSHSEKPGGEV